MKKNYILFLAAILTIQLSTAQSLSSSPTLTFTNNTGISSDNIANDGDGGSVNITDIDIQIYNISDINGTMIAPLSWENSNFYTAGTFTGITANVTTGRKGIAIKSSNGSEFKLNQFQYLNWGEIQDDSPVNTIKGYKDGFEVASANFQGYNNPFSPNTIILTAFDDVDEVRFYISSGGYEGNQNYTNHSINSIQLSSPVLSANSFGSSSKLNMFPNPTSSNITIELLEVGNSILEVYDITGKKLLIKSLTNKSNIIDVEKLNSGIYLFKVTSSEGISVNKITKN